MLARPEALDVSRAREARACAIQGEAMGRMRGANAPAETSDTYRQLNDAMIVTVQGVAAGMQNTG